MNREHIFLLILAILFALVWYDNQSFKHEQNLTNDNLNAVKALVSTVDSTSRHRDSLQWNYFSFSSFHLPDTYICLEQVVDFTRPQVRQRVEEELYKFLRYRDRLLMWWKLGGRYFPLIEESLAELELPDQLKILAILEGLLDPNSASYAKAVGIWQFIYTTGKEYGLRKNFYEDQRKDIWKSTKAACKHLVDLYQITWLKGKDNKGYQDWWLALAAYNAGTGRINNITRTEGTTDFWSLRSLPKETKRYVPQYIALCYIFDHPELLGLNNSPQYQALPEVKDTIIELSKTGSLKDLAVAVGINLDSFMLINTAIEIDKLPAGRYRVKTIVP
ncbi:MAG: transglycosylase SLT domain-containing protein [Patescibacteria group bacterium]